MMKQVISSIYFLFTLFTVQAFAQPGNYELGGQIINELSGQTMRGVHVQLIHVDQGNDVLIRTDVSDGEGRFSFTDLEAGSYALRFSYIGFSEKTIGLELYDSTKEELKILLGQNKLELGTVRVSTLRYSAKERQVAIPLEVITAEKIMAEPSITASGLASGEPGIALYRDGAWGTSVSVRGMGENRIIAMIDGNRIETAVDLAGGLSMLDVNELERVEIIKGAASSIHGTGALGGVVNFITKKGNYQEDNRIGGEVSAYYQGVNNLLGSHLSLQSGGKNWYLRGSGGFRQAQDMKTPEGILENSQFDDFSYQVSAGFRPLKNHELLLSYQDYRASDVGIPGGAAIGAAATATYLKAERKMASASYTIMLQNKRLQDLTLKYYNQYILRDVEMLPNLAPGLTGNKRTTVNRINPFGGHNTNGISFETNWVLADNHQLLMGIDAWQRRVETKREKYITQEILDDFQMIVRTIELVRGEQPIPDATFRSAGVFLQDQLSLLDGKLDLMTGARLDGIQVMNEEAMDPVFIMVNGDYQDPVPAQRIVFEKQTQFGLSWSMNAGALYHLSSQNDLALNLGRSFRSPSIEERFKYIDLGSKVRLGDPELKPEKGWTADLGYRHWNEKLLIGSNIFAHYLNDMIVEKPGQFVYNQTDTLPALVNSNVDKALLFGYEVKAEYAAYKNFVLMMQSAWVRGIDLLNDSNLPLISPMSSTLGFRYQQPGIFHIRWLTSYTASQKKIAAGEEETPAYWVSDFSIYSDPAVFGPTSFQLFLGVDNVFNASYVNHLSTNRGMIQSEPGRNVYIKLRMKF